MGQHPGSSHPAPFPWHSPAPSPAPHSPWLCLKPHPHHWVGQSEPDIFLTSVIGSGVGGDWTRFYQSGLWLNAAGIIPQEFGNEATQGMEEEEYCLNTWIKLCLKSHPGTITS